MRDVAGAVSAAPADIHGYVNRKKIGIDKRGSGMI